MSRIVIPDRADAPQAAQPLLDAVEGQLGVVPNLFRLLSISPVTLDGFLALHGALGKVLDLKTRNRIAIATAQANGCDYCLSAHSYLGEHAAKLDAAEMTLNRAGRSSDPKAHAAVAFAAAVARSRGRVSDADLAAVKEAGWTEPQIVEIVATVALNTLTNFLNNVADTSIDFPVVRTAQAA